MKFTQQVQVMGMKRSKGEFEGRVYDSTKFYIPMDLDNSKGNSKGVVTEEFNFGNSETFKLWEHLPFPVQAEAVFELVSTGKTSRMQLTALKPIKAA